MRGAAPQLHRRERSTLSHENAVALAAAMPRGPEPEHYVREKSVENHLRKLAKEHSDVCMVEKHESPGRRGVPDDLITWGHPLCIMDLIETKAPKGERKKHQRRDHALRSRYGIKVNTLYTVAEVDAYFATMLNLMSLT